jgi:hypothetical protein
MSDQNQAWPERNVPRSEQPTQQASWPQRGYPGQSPVYGSRQPYGGPGAPRPQYGAPPPYGGPQPYGAPPPHYGAPRYATPPPSYGAAGGHDPGRRPGIVTTAAVFAFVLAGLVIVTKFLALLLLATHNSNAIASWGIGLVVANYAILLAKIVVGALLVWGGVAALKGRTRRILLVVLVIQATLSLLGVVVSLATNAATASGTGHWYVATFLELTFVATILILILQPASRDFFRARRDKTT